MRRAMPLSAIVLFVSATSVLACSGAQDSEPVVAPDPPPPPPAVPQSEPRVWDNLASYRIGWPIQIRAGVLNTGEAVVNVPSGEFFGVAFRARRGEEEVECDDIQAGSARGGLFPLAGGSAAYRHLFVDRQCRITHPGTYIVEVRVTVPAYEGSDVEGEQPPVSITFEVPQPEQPLAARMVAAESYTLGAPMTATVHITNYGADAVRLAAASRIQVYLSAESNGETVPCEEPGRGRGGRHGDLAQGEAREIPVVLSERCQLALAGRYTITPRIEVPRAGARSFEGTLEAAPLEIEVVAPDEPPPTMSDTDE